MPHYVIKVIQTATVKREFFHYYESASLDDALSAAENADFPHDGWAETSVEVKDYSYEQVDPG